jgi:hypothetical protein
MLPGPGRVRLFAALAAILIVWSCTPLSYPPPAQIAMPSGPEPPATPDPAAGLIVAMSDSDADFHILGDVFPGGPGEEWRFTGLHPKFRLEVQRVVPLNFYIRFSNTVEMLRDRGPATFAIAIDGKPFHRFTAAVEPEHRWPVPDGWFVKPGSVEISIDISPPWHGPFNAAIGIQLHSVGFEER